MVLLLLKAVAVRSQSTRPAFNREGRFERRFLILAPAPYYEQVFELLQQLKALRSFAIAERL